MIENISNSQIGKISQGQNSVKQKTPSDQFQEILNHENLKFSQHAQSRLKTDNVVLSKSDISRIQTAMEKIAGKGGQESLLLMDERAFIVNPQEKIVITSINRERLKENVFTNIDSAVII